MKDNSAQAPIIREKNESELVKIYVHGVLASSTSVSFLRLHRASRRCSANNMQIFDLNVLSLGWVNIFAGFSTVDICKENASRPTKSLGPLFVLTGSPTLLSRSYINGNTGPDVGKVPHT